MFILCFNIHHVFIEGITRSFVSVPIGPLAEVGALTKISIGIVQEALVLGLRLAAPLITVQILINLSLGLLNRALPALNIFSIIFPVSFVICMLVLLLSFSSFAAIIASYGCEKEVAWFETMKRAFENHTAISLLSK
jgi:flagellar biosynthetic protein FliR